MKGNKKGTHLLQIGFVLLMSNTYFNQSKTSNLYFSDLVKTLNEITFQEDYLLISLKIKWIFFKLMFLSLHEHEQSSFLTYFILLQLANKSVYIVEKC